MSFTTEMHPGVHARDVPQASGFKLNHSMVRVKDPIRSLAFYTGVMGMRLLRRLDFAEMKFSLYFLARLEEGEQPPEAAGERTVWTFNQRGLLELTHNWGSEDNEEFVYHNGNADPQGFGHLCFSVPDLDAAVAWFDENEVEFVKRPDEGRMKDVAFIKDPDGYWIEIVEAARLAHLGDGTTENGTGTP